MSEPALLPLSEWESFYVIVGSSAAALTGLQFVVIALGESRRRLDVETTKAFSTPTVLHFCAVLLLAAILSTPRHTPTSLALCLLVCGFAGLVFVASVFKQTRRQKTYRPVREDWIWHTILPAVAYAALVIAGLVIFRHPVPGLFVVAATALLLLFVGIHNAWDAAVWLTTHRARG